MMITQPMFVQDAPSVSSHYEKASGVEKALEKALNGVKITQLKPTKPVQPSLCDEIGRFAYIMSFGSDWSKGFMVHPVSGVVSIFKNTWTVEGDGFVVTTTLLPDGLYRSWNVEGEVTKSFTDNDSYGSVNASVYALALDWGLDEGEYPTSIKEAEAKNNNIYLLDDKEDEDV